MKIGLYFGSFNPIHLGHLIIASYIADNTDLKEIWFVLSPRNPLKESSELLNEYQRLHLLRTAIEDDVRFKVCSIEFSLPKPSYTINTLTYLAEKYPQHEFSIILGSDSYRNLPNWKNADILMHRCNFIVYERPYFPINIPDNKNMVHLLRAPLLNISATTIRNYIRAGKSIKYLVPEAVRLEIEASGYFREKQ